MRYPLGVYERDEIKSKTGKSPDDITLSKVMTGEVSNEDIKISRHVLQMQAKVSLNDKKPQMAENFERAGELVDIPDEEILKIYDSLRPNRSTKQELFDIAERLKKEFGAKRCAELIMEAAEIYEKRGIIVK